MGHSLKSSPSAQMHAIQLGFVMQLMKSSGRANLSIGALQTWLMPPIKLGQIEIIFSDHGGHPIACMIWAFLSDDVVEEMLNGNERLLDISEWNEGDNFWVMDLTALPGSLKPILYRVLGERLPNISRVHGIRTNTETGFKHTINLAVNSQKISVNGAKYKAH